MIGIAEDNASAGGGNSLRGHRLDRAGRTDRHEHRRVSLAMRGRQTPAPRRAVARQYLKPDAHQSRRLLDRQLSVVAIVANKGISANESEFSSSLRLIWSEYGVAPDYEYPFDPTAPASGLRVSLPARRRSMRSRKSYCGCQPSSVRAL